MNEELTQDQIEMACAWSDYRKHYGTHRGEEELLEHLAFKAGWEAAKTPGFHESEMS